jgi:probable phosphomutase (TIGR03848 family)
MTTILLIRHAETDALGKTITGWLPGAHLNRVGVTKAERLAARLKAVPITAVYSSPLERATETARPLAERLGLAIIERRAFGEIHFGDWTGRTIEALDADPEWRRFNSFRSSTRAPGGEMMLEAQLRVVAELTELSREHPNQTIAVVSHGDIIRAAVAHYAGIPLDLFQRFEIWPASLTELRLSGETAVLVRLNDTGDL